MTDQYCDYETTLGTKPCERDSADPCDACAAVFYREILAGGVGMIAMERDRQIEEEGYDAAHDDTHNQSAQLARAGYLYARAASDQIRQNKMNLTIAPVDYPWDQTFWKPDLDRPIRNLVKAGALIAAEIDRLLRRGE